MAENLTKDALIAEISARLEAQDIKLRKADIKAVLDAEKDAVQDAVAEGKRVTVQGHLTIESYEAAPRTGRNPQTGEEIEIPARKRVRVRVASAFKDKVAGE